MQPLVNITYSSSPAFAWRSAMHGEEAFWWLLAGSAIFASRWHRVKRHPNGCWFLQMAASNKAGHILLGGDGRRVYAHRRAYEVAYGPVPDGRVVRHRCDDPACINPTHLLLGAQADNIHDCVGRERRNAFGRQRLQLSDVLDVRARFAAGESQLSIARAYGVSKGCIHAVVRRKAWGNAEALHQALQPVAAPAQQPDGDSQLKGGAFQFVHAAQSQPFRVVVKGEGA